MMNETSFWRPIAISAAAAVVLLTGALLWTATRRPADESATRRNVEALLRSHLDQRQPEKALAVATLLPEDAVDLRLEVARAVAPRDAVTLLDPIPLAGLNREAAGRVAAARFEAYHALFKNLLLPDGAIPALFEPPAYRLDPAPLPPREELSRTVSKLRAAIADRPEAHARRIDSLAAVAQYALGEIPYASVTPADDEVRFQFGDLLFRERQFDRALETWKPILGDPRVIRKIAGLAALRRLAPRRLHLWDYELDKVLGRQPEIEKEAASHVEALFKKSKPAVLPPTFERPRDLILETSEVEDPVFAADPRSTERVEFALDPTQLYLLVDHTQFRLEVPFEKPFLTKAPATLKLRTAYGGPLRFRLSRVTSIDALRALDEETFVARRGELSPVREWEQQFAPLWETGKKEETWTIEVPPSGPGLFVLMAETRYCPVVAVAKFIVTDVALVQQPALDRVLLFAADRLSGAPVAQLPIEGEVQGRYVLRPEDLLSKDDSSTEEFKRGFDASRTAKPVEPDASPSYVRGHRRATELRTLHPDFKAAFQGVTGKDGLFEWTVAPEWTPGYQYTIKTASALPGTYTRAESTYSLDPRAKQLKAIVYTDRPIYRPGDTVSFKAILRHLDGEGLQPYEGREVLVEFGTQGRTLFARTCAATDFGTASGAFVLPLDGLAGDYWARVNNISYQTPFRVDEYRKPEFEIVLNHPRRVRAGETVDVEILVRSFSGEAVPDASLTLELAAGRALESRALTCDAAGRVVYRVATDAGVSGTYRITARALEQSRHEVVRSSTFEATGRTREIAVETDRPSYAPGEVARLRILAPGAPSVRVEERANIDKPFALSLPLKDGMGTCDYPVCDPPRDLQVGVRDGDGWAWTPVPIAILRREGSGTNVTVRLDRATYRVGEMATISLRSTEPDQDVLLTFATGRIHRRQVVRLADRKAELPVEVRDEDVPNVTIVAHAIHNDHLGKATAELHVPPVDRFLTVEIETDLKEYRPGQECRASLRVLDSKGRPVPDCELSLGVVDEAVYSLREDMTPDLREFFHRYERPLTVRESYFFQEKYRPFILWKTPVFVRGQMNLYDVIGGGGGGGGRYGGRQGGKRNMVAQGGGGPATPGWAPRSDFKDTAYWNAHLRTSADGTATVTFAFPENLSGFRFTARGITKDHKVGAVRQTAVVRKPFFTRLATPRVVQEGNTIAVSGLVQNHTDRPQSMRFSFQAPFPVLRSTAPGALTLPPGETGRVEYTLSIDRYLPEAEFTFGAECTSGERDALTIRVPGRRHGVPFHEGRSGSVAAGLPREEVFRVPAGAIRGTLTLRLDVDAGLHSAIVEGLEPLIEYPYGCVEQTMSRFLPAVAAQRALGAAPHRWSEKLPSVVAAGLQRLYTLQQPDGGWGWWGPESPNHGITAYVLYGLATCKKAGTAVDRGAADRAAKLIRARLEQTVFGKAVDARGRLPVSAAFDPQLFEALALTEYESAWGPATASTRRLIATLADREDPLQPIEEAMLALACERCGLSGAADALARRVEKRPLGDVTTAALLLQLQVLRKGETRDAARYLLSSRTGKGWRSTIEGAWAILGLSALFERPGTGDLVAPGRVTVEANGVLQKELILPGRADPSFDGRISMVEPPAGWGGKVVVRLTFEGRGSATYTASLEAMVGGEDPLPVKRGLEVTREYLERDGDGWRPVDGPVRTGRPLLVHLQVTSSTHREYLMVTDPRADGFEPSEPDRERLKLRRRVVEGLTDSVDLSRDWELRLLEFQRSVRGEAARESAWGKALLREVLEKRLFTMKQRSEESELPGGDRPTRIEHRDDRTILFLEGLRRGTTDLYYVVRPELSGRFHVLPASATPMYEPEVYGAGSESKLEVTEGGAPHGPDRIPALAQGVAGLAPVVASLGLVDADVLIGVIPSHPRIGDLLMRVTKEPEFRAWLGADAALRASESDLRERIEAARRDLATRRLAVEALAFLPPDWLPALERALESDDLFRRVFEGATVDDVGAIDHALLWASEDREWRSALVAALQGARGSAEVGAFRFRPLTVDRIVAALGPKAPAGDALIRWKLAQRASYPEGDFIRRMGRDLGLTIRMTGQNYPSISEGVGRISEILDLKLRPSGLFYRIKDGILWIGLLAELLE